MWNWFIYLFGVLCHFQYCTGHITTGSWKGRGNQYIQFVRGLYCKTADQRQATTSFPTWGRAGNRTPASQVGGESVTTLPPWPPHVELNATWMVGDIWPMSKKSSEILRDFLLLVGHHIVLKCLIIALRYFCCILWIYVLLDVLN